jgi:hypothetical protein
VLTFNYILRGNEMAFWTRKKSTPADHIEIDADTYKRLQEFTLELVPLEINYSSFRQWRPWHVEKFGGSPIPIKLEPGGIFSHNSLYLGWSLADAGIVDRPDIDVVVNLCEVDDGWSSCDDDCRWPRGEGVFAYTWAQLNEDATIVESLLRERKRVLIHCMAGVNRSATLTCAALMRFERISAQMALERVARFHPRAKPEMRHWLALRQLEIVIAAEHKDEKES